MTPTLSPSPAYRVQWYRHGASLPRPARRGGHHPGTAAGKSGPPARSIIRMADRILSSDYFLQYLEEIDAGPYDVSDWEADFLGNMLERRPAFLNGKQEGIIRRMAKQYLHEDI